MSSIENRILLDLDLGMNTPARLMYERSLEDMNKIFEEFEECASGHHFEPIFYKDKLMEVTIVPNKEKKMTINEYQREALRTEPHCAEDARIVNGLMGLNGEAGEAIDLLKKHIFHGHILDRVHLAKELGDVAWYLAVSADALGYDLETIFEMNIDKLRARYPDGFNSERSQHRAVGDI